jgi:hypothetical protein
VRDRGALDSENGVVEYSPSFLEVVNFLSIVEFQHFDKNTSSSEETSKEIIWQVEERVL